MTRQALRARLARSKWYAPQTILRGLILRPRLIGAVGTACAILFLLPPTLTFVMRLAIAWDVGAIIYLALTLHLMSVCTASRIAESAEQEDESKLIFLSLIILAVLSSLWAVFGLIGEAKAALMPIKAVILCLAAFTIFASWLVMQCVFTLHYAHEYYRPGSGDGEIERGLAFPDDGHPDYWDFLYFTVSIGATSQTSDVAVTSKSLRKLVTLQSILAFVYNTTVVALAINVAAGLV